MHYAMHYDYLNMLEAVSYKRYLVQKLNWFNGHSLRARRIMISMKWSLGIVVHYGIQLTPMYLHILQNICTKIESKSYNSHKCIYHYKILKIVFITSLCHGIG